MSPPVVGIVCEYDPFHLGHARQFALIRQQLPKARIVCVMSGPFTQRGMPALYSPAFRAKAALAAGADLLLELPSLFALREAQHFALGSVSILHRLGFVSHLSFGCEHPALDMLWAAARLLEAEDAPYASLRKTHLDSGLSFAAAQGKALSARLGNGENGEDALSPLFSAPNNILAISYLRALLRLRSPMVPLPVLREGSYHAKGLAAPGFPSATAVRAALLAGETAQAEAACGYPFPATEPFCHPQALDRVLLAALRGMSKTQLAALPDCTEGLENRLYTICREATSREDLLAALKTKRYPHARLSRLCAHGLLSITAALQAEQPLPTYARLLGFRKESLDLLGRFPACGLPLIAKAADGPMENPAYRLDERAYDFWALGAGQPAGWMYRQPIQIL